MEMVLAFVGGCVVFALVWALIAIAALVLYDVWVEWNR